MRRILPALLLCAGWLAGCDAKPEATVALPPEPPAREERLEEPPIALNAEVPVGYPEGPAAQRIGGTVILKLFVDSAYRVVPESTDVQESSGYPALDSAASLPCPGFGSRRASATGPRLPPGSCNPSISARLHLQADRRPHEQTPASDTL
ncbi:MAG: hypothetical protein R2882_00235 [Gemmatimonadales bacterium]